MNRIVNLLFRCSGTVLVVYWVALFIGTHLPLPPEINLNITFLDKILHFSAYAGLAFLLAAAFTLRRSLSTGRYFAIFAGLALYGIFDESVQAIPGLGREADLLDWLADVCGVVSGLLVFAVVAHFARRVGLALNRNSPDDEPVNNLVSAPDSDPC